jgi:hypothetical protein
MNSLSATRAISPAIERTKQFLFQPFRLGRFLKLTLVALLTEGGISSCNFNSHTPSGKTGPMNIPFHWPAIHFPALAAIAGLLVFVTLISIPIVLVIWYLLVRLRFSYFDCVLYEQDQIAPAWNRYHRQAMRYLGLSVLLGTAFWAVLILIGYNLYQHFKPVFDSIGSDHPPGFADFLPLLGYILPLVLALGLAGYLVETTMTCFVLPRIAVEDASMGDALQDVWGDFLAEPGQFALFFLLRFLLSLVASVLGFIVLLVPLIPIAIVGVILALMLKAASTTLALGLGVPLAILAGFLFLVAVIGVSGTIGTFRRNYALLFYAGRYPELALAIWPPVPPVPPLPPQQSGYPSGLQPGV